MEILKSYFQKREQKTQQNLKEEEISKDISDLLGENQKELLLGGGAGALSFLAGYCHGLIEIVGKEKLKEYKIGCVSAGGIIGLVMYFVLRQDKYDLKYFYHEWFRLCYEKENKKYFGLFTNGAILEDCAKKLVKLLEDFEIESVSDNVHMTITQFNKFGLPYNQVITEYDDGKDLGSALSASCGIPLLIKPQIFLNYKGRKALDGGFSGQIPCRYENSQKVFINILPKQGTKFPFVWKQPKNLKTLHITENTNIYFPKDYWLWDAEWADDMFLRGILKAQEDIALIQDIFNIKQTKTKNNNNTATKNNTKKNQ